MRRASRRDANEAAIVEALRKVGAFVHYLDGRDTPDLLVGFRGVWRVLEVKRGNKSGGGPGLRPGQAMFFANALMQGCPAHVVRDVEGALAVFGISV